MLLIFNNNNNNNNNNYLFGKEGQNTIWQRHN